MKKSRRTYNGVHLNKKSNTQDVVEQSLTISSTVVIVLFFIFPLFRAFRPAAGIVFMCGFHGEGKDGRQGICGEIL